MMRQTSLLCLLLALGGISAAQDTNFATGPQYLMTNGSPLFARSISTPTLSFDSQPANVPVIVSEPTPAGEVSTSVSAQAEADLPRIYYGGPVTSVIEITAVEPPANLPASIMNVGVEQSTDAKSLIVRGYGVTLAEAASFWKMHKAPARRSFTNRDIERLHGG
jgi:hypothetical protein